jgi:hypothetical protein
MAFTLPYPTTPQNGQPGDATPILQNELAIAQAIANFDGSQIIAASVTETALANAVNPRLRYSEAFSNFVYSGCVWSVVSGANATMIGGTIYVNGYRVIVSGVVSNTFGTLLDTYVDIDYLGNVTYPSVSNGSTAPALTSNSIRVAKVVTNGSAITGIFQSGRDTAGNLIYNTGSVTAGNAPSMWWEELGRATLTASADTISVTGLPARKYLKVIIRGVQSGQIGCQIQFNSDTGANYARRFSNAGAADTTGTSLTGVTVINLNTANFYITFEVINELAHEKVASFQAVGETLAGAGSIPDRLEGSFKWANTANQISTVTSNNLGTGDYASGTEIVVLGHN